MLQKMGCLGEYTYKDGLFGKDFSFPSQEGVLIEHITSFKRKLGEVISKEAKAGGRQPNQPKRVG